jgi:hypothetical protein
MIVTRRITSFHAMIEMSHPTFAGKALSGAAVM